MRVLIAGAGPAGTAVAESLREMGFEGEIFMFTAEPFPPYSPPVLAEYLKTRGESKTIFWKGEDFAERVGAVFIYGKISALDMGNRRVFSEDGKEYEYDKLVIATGARMWIPVKCECPEEGSKEKFYNFKSLTAVNKLMNELKKGAEKAVVIGAGFIGMEIALSLREMGLRVTVVEMMNRILPRMVNETIARPLEEEVRKRGIELRLNSKAVLLRGRETAEELVLENGEVIKGELFIAATGVKPNVDFLKDSGLTIGKGIKVNEYLEAGPDVYAGGDVAEVKDIVTGNVYPHAIYPEAVAQGKVIAANLMGHRIPYPGGLNMNSLHHFGLPLISEGAMEGEEEPDEEIFLEKGGNIKRLLLKDAKILRFELVGEKKGAGLLHWITERRLPFQPYREAFIRGRLNTAFNMPFVSS